MNNDHKLQSAVLDELAWEPSVTSNHIGVTVSGGVVTLTGHVESYWQKAAAERAVGRVKGVRAIAEEIEVRLPGGEHYADDEIAAAAVHRLSWDASIPKDAVRIKVEKGHLTLTGEVSWNFQYEEAARSLRTLSGVKGVTNKIVVKHRPDTSKIKDDISHALHRSWYHFDHVDVAAKDGQVHLTGNVESWQDRNMASSMAWRAVGTTSVVNDIRVS